MTDHEGTRPAWRSRGIAMVSIVLLGAAIVGGVVLHRGRVPSSAGPGDFAGAGRCATCHAAEARAWRGSQHAVAMQQAVPGAVLGRFDGSSFTRDGLTSTFLRRGDSYVVYTEAADGTHRDFEVRYTFGVHPLQQYLVELPGGRVQPLPFAWDSRGAAEGGQRWFSLDPSPRPGVTHERHWAGRFANWNFMCADCHSTGVRKGYDPGTDSFTTRWSEIDVSCEACHGPGAGHAEWAEKPKWRRMFAGSASSRLPAELGERRGARWTTNPVSGAITRSLPRVRDREVETCAQCHARRTHIADGYTAGARFLDHYDPALLVPGLYHPDGQQYAEVFTYASFVQSRMYAAGVTCSDCHEPHSGKLRRPGNATCTQCHLPARYDTAAHHFHRTKSPGASCASCHMSDTTYMGVDRRRDHSFRIPRPDLTVELGVPNACTRCHVDRDARWAARSLERVLGRAPRGSDGFVRAFAMHDAGDPAAAGPLAKVAGDVSQPVIVRASALARLASYPGPQALAAAQEAVRDTQPLIRRAALDIVEVLPGQQRISLAGPLLSDERRVVRHQAAWALAPFSSWLKADEQRHAFVRAAAEFVESQRYNADRAQARLTLGAFYAARGQLDSAEAESRAAVRLAPGQVQPYLNLSGVLSMQGKFADAAAVLRDGLQRTPGDLELAYGRVVALLNAGRPAEARGALAELRRRHGRNPRAAGMIAELEQRVGSAAQVGP